MKENATIFGANVLLKQIGETDNSPLWLLSCINRYLLVYPDLTLRQFRDIINEQWPEYSEIFTVY